MKEVPIIEASHITNINNGSHWHIDKYMKKDGQTLIVLENNNPTAGHQKISAFEDELRIQGYRGYR